MRAGARDGPAISTSTCTCSRTRCSAATGTTSSSVPVAVHEAVLGARIDVPALDGTVKLRIPPGTQAGQRFRVSGRGVPSPSGGRGDLVVEVRLVLPASLDERSKELMREFGRPEPRRRQKRALHVLTAKRSRQGVLT